MPLISSANILKHASQGGYAVCAFNVENMEMVQAVLEAAKEARSPVIMQTTEKTLKYAPPEVFHGMVSALANAMDVPVALHLDHGSSLDMVARCAKIGYTSVMIDGSLLSFEDNISLTKQAVALAQGLQVEAELGTVGGKEDDREAGIQYAQPEQVAEFIKRTGVDSLAVAIGTAHGIYKGEPKVDLELLERISKLVDIPLVLHGTSGVPEHTVQEAIKLGIRKVNYATDLRLAYTAAVRQWCIDTPNEFDPKSFGKKAKAAVKELVLERMRLVGSVNRA